jgi:hypothetical protein
VVAPQAPHQESLLHSEEENDDSLLERLVAEFLAAEETPVRRYVPPSAEALRNVQREVEAADAASPRASDDAKPNTLPAVRGHRVPARTRLLERAPEVQRGAVKLLGSGRARRIGYDSGATAKPLPRALPEPTPHVAPEPAPRALPEPPPQVADTAAAPKPERKLSFPFMIG